MRSDCLNRTPYELEALGRETIAGELRALASSGTGGQPSRPTARSGETYLAGVSNEIYQGLGPGDVHLVADLDLRQHFLSSTLELYFQSFGPEKEIEGTDMSIAVIVAVIVRWLATVAPGLLLSALVRASSSHCRPPSRLAAAPAGRCCRRSRAEILSPTLMLENFVTVSGTTMST